MYNIPMAFSWNKLPRPIVSLAPMEDVTDTVFRQIIIGCGRPDVFFTEFTNVDGIASQGRDIVARRLLYTTNEHPIIAQIWGMVPENYYKAAQELAEKGFDGIDINMGCPQHDVTKHGACSALIKNHALAQEIIQATKEGARSGRKKTPVILGSKATPESGERSWTSQDDIKDLPVSVKTRIGFSKIATEEWIGFLLEQNLPLITVHGRTAAEMSKVPAHWDEIGKAVELRNTMNKATLIFGNGDVVSLQDAKEKVAKYHVDGVMVGRGVFHNPWLFAGIDPTTKTVKDRLTLLEQHVSLYEKTWGESKSFQVLKKYFKIYLSDFDGASDMRQQFMECKNYEEALRLAKELLASLNI